MLTKQFCTSCTISIPVFTKQEAEVDCEGAPPQQTDSKPSLHNGKVESFRESCGTFGIEAELEFDSSGSVWSKPCRLDLPTGGWLNEGYTL